MMRIRPACALGAFLACAALASMPASADSLEDCKQTKDPDLAIEACTTVLATAQGDQVIEVKFQRALAYFAKPDYYHAVRDFSDVVSIRPVQVAFIDRGLAYEGQMADDPAFADRAISDLTAAANLQQGVDDKIKAQFLPAYVTRAIANLKKGEDERALADEQVAIQMSPDKAVAIKADLAQAYKQRAWRDLAGGQYDGAVSDLQQAIQRDPTTADKLTPYLKEAQSRQPGPYSAIVRGDQHEEDEDYEQALKDYTAAIQANPNVADAHLQRGYAYWGLDRFEDARADFAEAIRLDPNGWSGLYARGQLYLSMDQFNEAAADFDRAAAIIEQVHDVAYENEKRLIEDARKALKFGGTLQNRWISYLKDIQAANTHPNWSGAPYDLYVKYYSVRNDVALQPGQPPKPNEPDIYGSTPQPVEETHIPPWTLTIVLTSIVLASLTLAWRYGSHQPRPKRRLLHGVVIACGAVLLAGLSTFLLLRERQPTEDEERGYWVDTSTGLMWTYNIGEAVTWDAAVSDCRGLRLGAFEDWRLPEIGELDGIYDSKHHAKGGLRLNSLVLSATQGANPGTVWGREFEYGDRSDHFPTDTNYTQPICVRRVTADVATRQSPGSR